MAQQNITRKKIFLAIVTKKEYAQMINIIKKKMRGRRPGDNDDNRLSFTSSVHHFPRRLKSLKKSGFEMITFFTQLFVYRCFKADTKKLTDNLGGWNYTLTHADVISGSVPDVLSDSIFSHFLLSSYSSRQWRQGTQQNLETWKRFPFDCYYMIPYPRVTCLILVLEIPCYFQGPIFCMFF